MSNTSGFVNNVNLNNLEVSIFICILLFIQGYDYDMNDTFVLVNLSVFALS